MSWAGERRFTYALGVTLALLLAVGAISFALYYDPASCFDSRHNGDELGVDCGGACERLCALEVAQAKVLWSRAFEVSPGKYNAVAYIENPNAHAGIRDINYVFKLVDASNTTIVEREGTAFITPNGISPIFESDLATGESRPARTFFEFTEEPIWHRATSVNQVFSVTGTRLLDTATRPRIDAVVENTSLTEYKDVEVIGVVFAADGNAVAASRTVIDILPKQGLQSIVFTWPRPFERRLEQCIVPADVVLLMDTSGSMNDLGGTPPQPISDAISAAGSFLSQLEEDDRLGIVTYATDASEHQALTLSRSEARAAINAISILPAEERGRTNIAAGIARGTEALLRSPRESKHSKVLVLLTDGRANAPTEASAESTAIEESLRAKLGEIVVYTIGLGDSINEVFLQELASSRSHYFKAATSQELGSIYQEISTAICERGPAIIDISPRSRSTLFSN